LATLPERALAWVNAALVSATDVLVSPLAALPQFFSLLVIALLTAVVVVPVIARFSNQARIRGTKRQMVAALMEMRLFNDDPRVVLRSARAALRHNLTYLRLTSVPVAILTVPLVLLVAHLDPFFGYSGLRPGLPALLTVRTVEASAGNRDQKIALHAPPEVRVDAGPVQLVGAPEVVWRITPSTGGDFVLILQIGNETIRKTLHVSDGVARRSPARVRPGVLQQLRYPSEPPLDANGDTETVAVAYGDAAIGLMGIHVHWTVVYFSLTVVCTLLLARLLRISL
jgi:hypothetical protein